MPFCISSSARVFCSLANCSILQFFYRSRHEVYNFPVPYNPSLDLWPRPNQREICEDMFLMHLWFLVPFLGDIFSHIDSTCQRSLLLASLSLCYFLWVLPTSVSWWYFTGVWVTASLFKSPGLFVFSPVVWIVSIPIFNTIIPFPSLWGPFQQ